MLTSYKQVLSLKSLLAIPGPLSIHANKLNGLYENIAILWQQSFYINYGLVQSRGQVHSGLLLGLSRPLPTFSMLALLSPALGPPSVATQLACHEGRLVCPSWP